MSSTLWLPGAAGPFEEFVKRLHRQIEAYAEEAGVAQAFVEVVLMDGSRIVAEAISPEPGFGFLTIVPHPDADGEEPARLIIPIGSIKRIELDRAEEPRARLGFSLPET
jgi:hypothetical protein